MGRFQPAVRLPGLLWRYAFAVAVVGLALGFSLLLRPLIEPNPFLFFFAAVALATWRGGLGPALVATLLSMLVTNYFLIPPFYAFALDGANALRLAAFVFVATLISWISEQQRRAEASAVAQREQLAVTITSIGDGVIVTDVEGRVTLLNPVAAALTGWANEQACGQPIAQVFRIVNETTRRPVESPIDQVLREGVVVGLANHTLLLARDGSEHAIDDSGAPIRAANGAISGAVLVFRDITERRREEAGLLLLAEATTLLVSSLDSRATLATTMQLLLPRLADYCVIELMHSPDEATTLAARHVNGAKQALLEEFVQRYPLLGGGPTLMGGAVRSDVARMVPHRALAQLRMATPPTELLGMVEALGVEAWISVPLRARGQLLGVLLLVSAESGRTYDQRDMRLAEELAQRAALALDNARLYEQAQQAIRLRETFLSIASHELKTPLTSLLGNLQLLQRRASRDGEFSPRNLRALEVAAGQGEKLNRMIGALLDVSRIEQGQLSIQRAELDLVTLTQRVVQETQADPERYRLLLQAPPEPIVIQGDELRLEQVLQNLISNAIKYSPAGGTVHLLVEQRAQVACVVVRDQGIGIPAAALPNLFQRFYRADNADTQHISGIGIGLYVVKEIVSLHAGSVQVESVEGEGSTFTVCLPIQG